VQYPLPYCFILALEFIPKDVEEKVVKDTTPKRFGKIIDIPGLITLILTVSTFMLSITFLGGGNRPVNWIILDFLGYRNRIDCGVLRH
jgi:hypothetical protein